MPGLSTLTPYHAYQHERNYGCRISEWTIKGYRTLVMENNFLRVSILAGKGTDIFELLYKPLDVDIMLRLPAGLRSKEEFSAPAYQPGSPILDQFFGGWFEMFPNAGFPFEHQGLNWGLHGEVTLQAWDVEIVKNTAEEIALCFLLRTLRTPFHLKKIVRMKYNQACLFFEETITNEGAQPMNTSWGQHPCFGWPFIDDSCRIYLPQCQALTLPEKMDENTRFKPGQNTPWPLLQGLDGQMIDASLVCGANAACQDHIYLTGYDEGWYAITNHNLGLGFGMQFDPRLYRFLTCWQVYRGALDYPWWGGTYNIALEPQTSYPNLLPEQIRAGNALHFEPGQSRNTQYCAAFYTTTAVITGISSTGLVRTCA